MFHQRLKSVNSDLIFVCDWCEWEQLDLCCCICRCFADIDESDPCQHGTCDDDANGLSCVWHPMDLGHVATVVSQDEVNNSMEIVFPDSPLSNLGSLIYEIPPRQKITGTSTPLQHSSEFPLNCRWTAFGERLKLRACHVLSKENYTQEDKLVTAQIHITFSGAKYCKRERERTFIGICYTCIMKRLPYNSFYCLIIVSKIAAAVIWQ